MTTWQWICSTGAITIGTAIAVATVTIWYLACVVGARSDEEQARLRAKEEEEYRQKLVHPRIIRKKYLDARK